MIADYTYDTDVTCLNLSDQREARREADHDLCVMLLPRLPGRHAGRDGRQQDLQGAEGEPGQREADGRIREARQ